MTHTHHTSPPPLQVDFPVEALRLGDVPFVLPALPKQQGRLGFISDAAAFPSEHPLAGTIVQFMAAVSVLKAEMDDAASDVAALAPGREASSLAAFAGGASASAGLGIVVPVMAGAAVELNWALWHREGASSVANSFRVQVSG